MLLRPPLLVLPAVVVRRPNISPCSATVARRISSILAVKMTNSDSNDKDRVSWSGVRPLNEELGKDDGGVPTASALTAREPLAEAGVSPVAAAASTETASSAEVLAPALLVHALRRAADEDPWPCSLPKASLLASRADNGPSRPTGDCVAVRDVAPPRVAADALTGGAAEAAQMPATLAAASAATADTVWPLARLPPTPAPAAQAGRAVVDATERRE
mmetsp:Transcript_24048/g.60002  ORF Transcript_24048/g.60002 Transcript_24048/m.60002 type:complete len:217 (-) Transcript_24048:133-783(-)